MNTNTYAKLIKPPQFAADGENVIFRLEYSRDLSCNYAQLIIDGYTLGYGDASYNGCSIIHYINTSQSGTGIEEFVVSPSWLGQIADENDAMVSTGGNGTMRARVVIGRDLVDADATTPPDRTADEIRIVTGKEPSSGADILIDKKISEPYVCQSNETNVDFVWWWEHDFYLYQWENGVEIKNNLTATSSNFSPCINYEPRESVATYGSCSISSYCVLIYDENYNLVSQTDEFFDWNDADRNKQVLISELADNTTYYLRVKAVLTGGYVRYSDYAKLTVKYEEIPSINSDLEIYNDMMNGCVCLKYTGSISHTSAVLTRTEVNSGNYLELKTIGGNITESVLKDYYALPNTTYVYRLVLFNGNEIAGTFYNIITHKFNGLCIADAHGAYTTEIFETIPVNKNDRAGILEAMDSGKPYSIVNGTLDYDSSGGISATFAEKNECSYNFNPDGNANATLSKRIRNWLNNGKAKLLKLDNGECWIVSVNGVSTDYDYKQGGLARTTFGWTEIANATSVQAYTREGLVL